MAEAAIGTATTGTQTFDGGTGRFESASGSSAVTGGGHGDLFEIVAIGTISYWSHSNAASGDLRQSLTPYDAWYVAIAEELDATLVTLDTRLTRSHGPSCLIETVGG